MYLLFINKRTYAVSAPGFNGGGRLSERYQLSENVRTTRLLYPLMVVFFVLSVIAVVVMSLAGNRIGDSGKARSPQQFYAGKQSNKIGHRMPPAPYEWLLLTRQCDYSFVNVIRMTFFLLEELWISSQKGNSSRK